MHDGTKAGLSQSRRGEEQRHSRSTGYDGKAVHHREKSRPGLTLGQRHGGDGDGPTAHSDQRRGSSRGGTLQGFGRARRRQREVAAQSSRAPVCSSKKRTPPPSGHPLPAPYIGTARGSLERDKHRAPTEPIKIFPESRPDSDSNKTNLHRDRDGVG